MPGELLRPLETNKWRGESFTIGGHDIGNPGVTIPPVPIRHRVMPLPIRGHEVINDAYCRLTTIFRIAAKHRIVRSVTVLEVG